MKTLLLALVLALTSFHTPLALAQETAASPAAATSSGAAAQEWVQTALKYAIQWLPSVLGALVVLVLSLIIGGWVRRAILAGLTRAKLDPTLARFISNLARWGVLFLGFMAAAGTFGINITGFAAILGAVGLAISLGFQGTLSNLASGVLLLVFRPFKVGDMVVAAGQTGKVDAIDLFTTTLDTPDNRRIIVPNGAIFGGTIENITHHDARRIDVKFAVGHDAGVDATKKVLQDTVDELVRSGTVLADPAPIVILAAVFPPAWQVGTWAKRADFGPARQATMQAVKRALDQAGLSAIAKYEDASA